MAKSSKKRILQGLRLIFFLGLGFFFIWLFLRNLTPEEKQQVVTHLKEANYFWIILSILFGFISNLSRSSRWKILLRTMGHNPRYGNVILSVFIAYFANLAIPRLGEVSRCLPLAKYEKIPFEKSFGTVVTERAFDLLVFFIIFVINVIIQFNKLWGYLQEKVFIPLTEKFTQLGTGMNILILLLVIAAGAGGLLFIMRNKNSAFIAKIRAMVTGFADGLKSIIYIKKPILFILHTLNIWFMYFLMTQIVFRSLPETAHLGPGAGMSVLMLGAIGIMLVQGGIGLYQTIVAEALTLYGIVSTTGYAMGWLLWSGQTVMIIIAGVISLILLPLLNKDHDAKTEIPPEVAQ
ncbi:MAG: TIGR00374 family protein [Bacteroidetes bacterium]|nr:MAG: TIGR00374 family protein [Bacteroidota bacterium]